MNYKNIIAYIVIILFSGVMYYLSGFYGILQFILSLCFYTILFYFFHFIWSKIRNKTIMYFSDFINYFTIRISIFLIFITCFFGGLAYLSNEVYPAPMPEYTISNGIKEVKFQSMSHIGTKNFYDAIVNNLTEYKKNGGVYFYEGVRPGSEENKEKFDNAIGIKFDDDLYKNFGKLYGVENQDNSKFMGLVNDLDYNVDLNMNEIVELYEEKTINKEKYESKVPVDANKVIIETLSELNDRQLKILVYINQAILNFIIGSSDTQSFLTDNYANKDLFDVILGERNIVIRDAIINSEHNHIYMTYGLLHFKGVMKILQEQDPNWKIVSQKNLYPIKN